MSSGSKTQLRATVRVGQEAAAHAVHVHNIPWEYDIRLWHMLSITPRSSVSVTRFEAMVDIWAVGCGTHCPHPQCPSKSSACPLRVGHGLWQGLGLEDFGHVRGLPQHISVDLRIIQMFTIK